MSYKNDNSFIITHDSVAGYDDVDKKFYNIIKNHEFSKYLNAYTHQIVAYASDSRYAGTKIETLSFIAYKEYLTRIVSKPENDGRTYLKSKVTVCHIEKDKDKLEWLFSSPNPTYRVDDNFEKILVDSMFLAMLSGNTKFYCVTSRKGAITYLRNVFLACGGEVFPKYNSYVEVLGNIPEVRASVVTCICATKCDRDGFIRYIEQEKNYVLLDWVTDTPKLTVHIEKPSYAQSVVSRLQKQYNWNSMKIEIIKKVEKFKKNRMSEEFSVICNLAAYSLIYNNKDLKRVLGDVYISTTEKTELKNIYRKKEKRI